MNRSFVVAVALSWCVPALVSAQEAPTEPSVNYELSGSTLTATRDEVTHTVELPCTGRSLVTAGEALYVACEESSVAVLSVADPLSPEPVELRSYSQPAQRVFLVGGVPWVELGTTVAKPLADVDPERAPDAPEEREDEPVAPDRPDAPDDEPATPPEPVVGRVVEIGAGEVIVDLGRDRGVERGDRLEIYTNVEEDLGGGELVVREQRQSIGTVASASDHRSRVTLGLNEKVDEGALVRPTSAPVTGSIVAPPRWGGLWETYVAARPFLALGTLGGGAIIDGSVTYRFEAPLALELIIAPFGFGIAEAGDIVAFAGNVFASYDTTPFQIGIGAGVSKINTLGASPDSAFFIPTEESPVFRAGLSVAQYVRLGARDGLHLTVLNNFILFNEEFGFGGLTGEAQVPVRLFADHAWLVVRGGGGVPGHGFGEFGIRLLAVGNGGPGSIFLTPTVGGGVLFGDRFTECEAYYVEELDEWVLRQDQFPGSTPSEPVQGRCREEFSYGGPLIGFGVEWRM